MTQAPTLTLEQEFQRDQDWKDWKGVEYTLKEEWAYVNGAASHKYATPGSRDANNVGKTPDDFLASANEHIAKRRRDLAEAGLMMLPEKHAFLTKEEVLAVRMYSGPAYQPINTFLRAVSQLSGGFRDSVAKDPSLTFAATVRHLCRAIRKLAAVATPAETSQPLFRGVRGALPRTFWVPDEQAMICAVDTAFMSTSRNRQTPVDYMGSGENVLWQLQPQKQSDAAYHRGADIKMLSQFAGEDEVLFPPCTMLEVRAGAADQPLSPTRRRATSQLPRHVEIMNLEIEQCTEGKSTYLAISVLPSFI